MCRKKQHDITLTFHDYMALIVHERYAACLLIMLQAPVASPITLKTPYIFYREYENMQLITVQ